LRHGVTRSPGAVRGERAQQWSIAREEIPCRAVPWECRPTVWTGACDAWRYYSAACRRPVPRCPDNLRVFCAACKSRYLYPMGYISSLYLMRHMKRLYP
jgi:hypothetical protein